MNAIPKSVILVVDDDLLVRVHSQFALEDAGFEVIEAGNAADALARLDERPDIAALFTDTRMPGTLDGVGLARAVHARRPDISILVKSSADDGHELALPDAAHVVRKPYSALQLGQMLVRMDSLA